MWRNNNKAKTIQRANAMYMYWFQSKLQLAKLQIAL